MSNTAKNKEEPHIYGLYTESKLIPMKMGKEAPHYSVLEERLAKLEPKFHVARAALLDEIAYQKKRENFRIVR